MFFPFGLNSHLQLVGPFELLAGKLEVFETDEDELELSKYHIHWRYFFDPPECVSTTSEKIQTSKFLVLWQIFDPFETNR